MRLDHNPDTFSVVKLQSVARRQRQVHLELRAAAIDDRRDDHISRLQPPNNPRQNIARTQAAWTFCGQQQVAGANANTQLRADLGSNQRCLQFHGAASQVARRQFAPHGAAIFVKCQYRGVEYVFESRQMRGGFQLRGAHDFVRLPLCHDSTGFENHDFIAQCEHFFAIVRDQQNWNAVVLIPVTQIADERRLCRLVKRSQRFIEQQSAWFGHQRARQSDALALAARDLRRPAIAHVNDAECIEDFAAARLPLRIA